MVVKLPRISPSAFLLVWLALVAVVAGWGWCIMLPPKAKADEVAVAAIQADFQRFEQWFQAQGAPLATQAGFPSVRVVEPGQPLLPRPTPVPGAVPGLLLPPADLAAAGLVAILWDGAGTLVETDGVAVDVAKQVAPTPYYFYGNPFLPATRISVTGLFWPGLPRAA